MNDNLQTAIEAVDRLNEHFGEFRAKNDERIGAIETVVNRMAAVGTVERSAPAGSTWRSVIPSMVEYKTMQTGVDPSGGYLVTATLGPFFDRLRPESVVLAAGPMILPCDSDALNVPRLTSSTTAYRVGELATITASDAALFTGRIPMQKYGCYSLAGNEWLADAGYGPRQIIENDHRRQLAAQLDSDFLQGSSGSSVVGLRYQGTATSLAAAGAAPTLNNILDALYRMEANNALPSAIFMHPRTWNTIRKLEDTQTRKQLSPDPTQPFVRQLFGVPVYLSSQLSITEDSDNAANSDCSAIIIADMRYVVVAQRQSMSVLLDPYSYSQSDQHAIRTTTRWGLGVIFDAAVEVLTGVRQ
ncbi:MAG: phage major capsid protein [Acidobacteria bacterium]|nr:phage major capsid protein [Acidobacteriota bacterium]